MAWNCLANQNYDYCFKSDSYKVQAVADTSVRRNARRRKPRAKPTKPSVYLNKNCLEKQKKKRITYTLMIDLTVI